MKNTWPAPAKLNLFLYINGRRADGYHHLQTLFQFLDFGDTLSITPNESGDVTLLTPINGVLNKQNLIIRAARLLMQQASNIGKLPRRAGVSMMIDKRLPMGAGLGGGSSNAATVLLVLNQLWQTGFNLEQLAMMGLTLGADVPLFVKGHAAFAEGVGEQLQPIEPEEKWYLVIHPGVSISTLRVFNDAELKRNTPRQPISYLMQAPFSNDCEPIVRKRYFEVEQLVLWLLEYAPSRLTGSGTCVFAEFETESAARQVLERAPKKWWGFVARGANVSSLHHRLFEHSAIIGNASNQLI